MNTINIIYYFLLGLLYISIFITLTGLFVIKPLWNTYIYTFFQLFIGLYILFISGVKPYIHDNKKDTNKDTYTFACLQPYEYKILRAGGIAITASALSKYIADITWVQTWVHSSLTSKLG